MSFIHFAPVQGHTDAPYRHFHHNSYNSPLTYYTPFIRLEKDGLRSRDIKDFTSSLNDSSHVVPQIIFRDKTELNTLVKALADLGATEINLNMGCPFPLQTGHGRGAATISNPNIGEAVADTVSNNPDIHFSVKMRLGYADPNEWKILLPFLNSISLRHITLHPRVAKQQYGGDVNYDGFDEFLKESVNPVLYNGDVKTLEDIEDIKNRFPEISGIMIARGLLGRPSLADEWERRTELSREERLEKMLNFHTDLLDYYNETLCGESQVVAKIKPFWEYAENEIGRKAWKAIKKAGNIAKYHSAVAMIGRD